ncbi:ABC transporter ATP-binding protein [Halegenticoccus soli]|uniref:ABC transporter ATP-binding protein n=1 Tax=Halegenticoccus soli TaxID=1985678 RepID=UPI000C6D4683|nr:ABC transporter ATP-binding protein [Halegenticoccus soli]
MAEQLLVLDDVTKDFGSIRAVDGFSLEIPAGEVTAVIGPNGAGKTTLFNLLTGKHAPTAGRIFLRDERIDGKPPHEIVRMGVARSYQITNFFPKLTALENVRLAAQARHTGFSPRDFLTHYADLGEPAEAAYGVLRRLGLEHLADEVASTLSHGQQRHLEIGIALAADPDVLFMDEPTAGMSPEETAETKELIQDLAADLTLVIVEHDMEVVMESADNVAVMNRGSLLATGTPDSIQENEAVQRAYLGGGGAV